MATESSTTTAGSNAVVVPPASDPSDVASESARLAPSIALPALLLATWHGVAAAVLPRNDAPSHTSRQALTSVALLAAFCLLPWQSRYGPLGVLQFSQWWQESRPTGLLLWLEWENRRVYYDYVNDPVGAFVFSFVAFWSEYLSMVPISYHFWTRIATVCWGNALFCRVAFGSCYPLRADLQLLWKALPLAAIAGLTFPLFVFSRSVGDETIHAFAFALAAAALLAKALRLPPERPSAPVVIALLMISFGALLTTSLSFIPVYGAAVLHCALFFALFLVFVKRAILDFDGDCVNLLAYTSLACFLLLSTLSFVLPILPWTWTLWRYYSVPFPLPHLGQTDFVIGGLVGGLVVLFLFALIRATSPYTVAVAATASCHHYSRLCDLVYVWTWRSGWWSATQIVAVCVMVVGIAVYTLARFRELKAEVAAVVTVTQRPRTGDLGAQYPDPGQPPAAAAPTQVAGTDDAVAVTGCEATSTSVASMIQRSEGGAEEQHV